ncbi:transmembrane amino acid transporter protein [Glomus cerebriforme]|uniref:Transmembrane amino acid transporter protein n=1 Tax=Glomus cerebriforme TaxID=658196 RepID=A0A397SDZ3_9GLOM|nr:transmembrane amino acid transporter protein [Glomus cerebriforme]
MSNSSRSSSSGDSTIPINIPTTQTARHRRRGTGNLSNLTHSLAGTLQSWTGNYSHTASTYMSNNIVVPASFIEDNYEPTITVHGPGSHFSHIPVAFGQNQQHPSYFSPGRSSQYYGSFLAPSIIPSLPPLTENNAIPIRQGHANDSGDYLGTSYSSNRHTSMWRNSANEINQGHKKPIKISEQTTPLVRTLSRSSFTSIPISVMQDIKHEESFIGSNFRQSIFNSCNILIGIGILALPLGFHYSGWIIGLLLFAFCLAVTNYTAKVLAKCLDYDEGLYTYADMGAAAFGHNARLSISILFTLELIASATALVILVGDSLHTIFPDTSIVLLKVIAWMIMTPLTFIAIRYLSYFSLLGILSAMSLVTVIIIDGFVKHEKPGSLIDHMETEIWPAWSSLPMSFGLIMAGFTGHAVFPTVYRDMQNPKQYPRMVNITYAVTTVVYLLLAVCGYLMFGDTTMQEITQNIMLIDGYWRPLNNFVIWLVAINPIAKYALTLNPINLTLELSYYSSPCIEGWLNSGRGRRTALKAVSRILVSTLVVLVAVNFPQFDRIMGVLGSFFSYTISAIFPCVCHLKLFGPMLKWKEYLLNVFIIFICGILSALGTIWAFLPTDHV